MKFEILNPKSETNSNDKNSKFKTNFSLIKAFWSFEHLNFDIVSSFDIRVSNLKQGFTLIEILVVATIIGLLSTIGISGFQAVTRSGRDALRKTDLEQIRSALEIYKSENNRYPDGVNCAADLSTDYLNPYPPDPKPESYRYCYVLGSGNLSYQLCAHLENGEDSDTGCGSGTHCGPDDSAKCNYQVVNP